VGEIRKRERRLQLGYMFRYNPAFRFAFDAARDGLLGKIYEIHGVMGKTIGPAERDETAQFAGGMMFELGCHLIDAVVRLLGVPTKVHAHLRQSQPKPGALADNTLAVLEYPDALATIRSAGIDVEGGARRQLNVSGNRGAVSIVPLEPPKATLTLAEAKAPYAKGTQKLDLPPMAGRYTAQMAGFAQMIRSSAAPEFDLAHELSVFEAVLKASGMPVE
ncbi:MAG: Gfo/Idh/MocA family protein, partial [Phycisphaerae bacterium]